MSNKEKLQLYIASCKNLEKRLAGGRHNNDTKEEAKLLVEDVIKQTKQQLTK
jgi:hypothetical protein|tara:strand:+ start:843 stop:998 length:156 start_codon:yes stop_codon:yes gene_type:complete